MNRRKLKKEINKHVEQFADKCLELESKKPAKSKEINALIDDAAELIDDVMEEIAKTSQFVGREVKVHYARLAKDFDDRLEALEAQLAKLN